MREFICTVYLHWHDWGARRNWFFFLIPNFSPRSRSPLWSGEFPRLVLDCWSTEKPWAKKMMHWHGSAWCCLGCHQVHISIQLKLLQFGYRNFLYFVGNRIITAVFQFGYLEVSPLWHLLSQYWCCIRDAIYSREWIPFQQQGQFSGCEAPLRCAG